MAILVGALGMVFSTVWKMDIKTYLPYLATGFMIWLPMSQIILEGGHLFIGAEPILKQVNLPFTVFACANVAHNMLVMAHYFIVWAVVVVAFQVSFSLSTLLFIPGVMLICINGVWISIIAGLACARYRDIEPLLASILQIVLFVTPIMWTADQLGRKGALFVDVNIVFHFIEIVRKPLLGGVPEILSYQIVLATTLVGWIVTVLVFSRCRRYLVLWL
jgi:ABC-type polysaccharide/polyol phosphate export permease